MTLEASSLSNGSKLMLVASQGLHQGVFYIHSFLCLLLGMLVRFIYILFLSFFFLLGAGGGLVLRFHFCAMEIMFNKVKF